jgi:hypothetical protein
MLAQIFSFIENFFRTIKILPKYPKKISKEKLQKLPSKFYDGAIHFINGEETASEAVAEIMQESVLGFDTESKPAFLKEKNTCLPSSKSLRRRESISSSSQKSDN